MKVIVMRRDLTIDERTALQRAYPTETIEPVRTEPQSAKQHLADCETTGARIVFLPHEQPIPTLAMQAGIKHLLLKDGQLFQLVRVVPEFEPYIP